MAKMFRRVMAVKLRFVSVEGRGFPELFAAFALQAVSDAHRGANR